MFGYCAFLTNSDRDNRRFKLKSMSKQYCTLSEEINNGPFDAVSLKPEKTTLLKTTLLNEKDQFRILAHLAWPCDLVT